MADVQILRALSDCVIFLVYRYGRAGLRGRVRKLTDVDSFVGEAWRDG